MNAGRKSLTAIARKPDTGWANVMAGFAFLAAVLAPQMPLLAQGLSNSAIDAIVGTDVKTEQESATADSDQVMKAIDGTSAAISAVHKAFNLDKVEIVFLPDLDRNQALKDKIEKHKTEINELRGAIEGSAMFFHAVDSRRVNLVDIVAVSFTDENNVRIYAAGKPAAE